MLHLVQQKLSLTGENSAANGARNPTAPAGHPHHREPQGLEEFSRLTSAQRRQPTENYATEISQEFTTYSP